jgi:hypothetical protein
VASARSRGEGAERGRNDGGQAVVKRRSDGGCDAAVASGGEAVAADAATMSSYTAS